MKRDKNSYKLLVVEDNPGDYVLIEDYLDEHIVAPTITHATTYSEARQYLEQDLVDFQVILLDLTLPDKSGEDLIVEMVEKAKNLPVIVLTGFTNIEFAIKSLTLGVSDYLLKDDLTAQMLYKSIIYNIERKKSLVRLQESEKRYSNLFHFSPQPMWVYDDESLRFLDVNDATINHYGYSKEELADMTIRDIHPEEKMLELDDFLREIREKNLSNLHSTITHCKKDGTQIIVDIHCNLIQFKGRPARLVLANDITDKVNYIEAVELQNKTLREIAWIQSHVVRAPLARIMGLIDLFQSDMVEEAEKANVLNEIQNSACEMDHIVKDIVTKSEQIKLKTI